MNRNTLLLVGVFALGGAAGLLVDSRAHAQGFSPPMPKWTQVCEESTDLKHLNEKAQSRGEAKFELVGIAVMQARLIACYKRPSR